MFSRGACWTKDWWGVFMAENQSSREATSPQIEVDVEAEFVPEQSDLESRQFFFAYRVRISHHRGPRAQLLERHWIITDGWGRIQEVRGAGVVGQQPWISSGESFEYSSFCPLPTASGSMKGTYLFRTESGEDVRVEIPLFFLMAAQMAH